MNQMQFQTGLAIQNSSNPILRLQGNQMMQDSVNSFSSFIDPKTGKNKGSGKAGVVGTAIGVASDIIGSFLPQKDEYDGPKGDVTQTMDSVYDGISDAAMSLGPVGMLVGGIMKGGAMLGKGVNALGGGTDGMCVCAGTKVFTSSGKVVNIEDLQKEEGIIGWNEETKEIKPQAIHNFIEPRQKECIEIVLKNGYSIRCSIDHPILSDNNPKAKSKYINGKRIAIREWKFRRADELKTGDFVGLANNIDYWGDNHLDNAYLVGLLIGDGSYGKGASCRIISADQDTWKYLEDNNLGIINHCDDSRLEKYNKEIRTYRIIGGMELLHQLGISYQTGKNKTLPKNIGTFDKSSVCNLLAGLFDTDGSISVNQEKKTYSITLYQSNIDLLEEVRTQLHKLGIFSTIGTRKATKYELGGKIINSKESYRLEIHDISSALKFCNLIPLNISYKKENLSKIQNMLKDKKAQEHNDISGAKQCKIVSITPIGVQTVYNLQADYDHTYLANCIITHNTTTDAILGSSFLNLTPIGLINGFGGSKADTITKDDLAFEQVGSSYTGSNMDVNNALTKSGKKYGLFSQKAKNKANKEIQDARRQQYTISNIADDAYERFAIRNSMAAINGNRRAFNMQGGYDQQAVRIGRSGLKIDSIEKAKNILNKYNKQQTNQLQQGGTLDPFEYYLESLPENQRDSTNFRVKDYWIFNGKPKDFKEARRRGMFTQQSDGWHANTIAWNPETGEGEFMKSPDHPSIQQEVEWYNSDDGAGFRNDYELVKSSPYWKYVRRKEIPSHKQGGSFIELAVEETSIELINPMSIPEFQKGGTLSQKVKDYYNGYDLSDVTLVNDSSPRTEGSIIYSPSDEYTVHELWHYLSQNKPNEALKEFYDQLDDTKLQEFGADLEFVKRTGDPGDFYNPSELEARLKAAKFMSQGSLYDKEFFRNLRGDETRYGDNMRDLLRMFDDDHLERLFNVLPKFQNGGSINVIPDGALHARKHNMDIEGITKKGIPVVSEKDGEIEQQAEIEKEEIIFRLEVTQKLEELEKKFYSDESTQEEKDECALEAGKLLVNEILYNTQDNSGKLLK